MSHNKSQTPWLAKEQHSTDMWLYWEVREKKLILNLEGFGINIRNYP